MRVRLGPDLDLDLEMWEEGLVGTTGILEEGRDTGFRVLCCEYVDGTSFSLRFTYSLFPFPFLLSDAC